MIIATLFLTALNANAEILICEFPNPALVITYNGATNQVSILQKGDQPDDVGIIPSTQLYIKKMGLFEIQTIEGKNILSVSQTYQARLESSQNIYPFEATYTFPFDQAKVSAEDQILLKSQKGVCESALLKKKIKQ